MSKMTKQEILALIDEVVDNVDDTSIEEDLCDYGRELLNKLRALVGKEKGAKKDVLITARIPKNMLGDMDESYFLDSMNWQLSGWTECYKFDNDLGIVEVKYAD